ncbi:MAG: phosphatidylglycerophosphatase A [Gammaproteobacteria bacterium]|nr:phosphatidylglycerophosphatase A [Gammaproteobacteria bacterium]
MAKQRSLLYRRTIILLATGFGSGLSPIMPGTCGTLIAIPIYLILRQLPQWLYLGIILAFFLFGIWLCQQVTEMLGEHDHPSIVWDEIVGYLFTMALAPNSWILILAGFLLFRLFDIWKPWPIRNCDKKIAGGFGIMLDDLLAALYSATILTIIANYLL